MNREVNFVGLVPIPRGHDVEVVVFASLSGIFTKSMVPHPEAPLVIDHTDGIWYGSLWHYQVAQMYTSGQLRPDIPSVVRSDLQVCERIRGFVVASRVVSIGSGDSAYAQTTLLIDVKA